MSRMKILLALTAGAASLGLAALVAAAPRVKSPKALGAATADPRVAEALASRKPMTEEDQFAIRKALAETRAKERIEGLREKTPPADWIDVSYHGALYDANYEPLVIDEKTAIRIQESLFEIASDNLDPKASGAVDAASFKSLFYSKDVGDGFDRLVLRSSVLDAMLRASTPKIRDRYEWRNLLLQREIRNLDWQRFGSIRDVIRRMLENARIILRPGDWLQPREPTTAYMDACAAAEVPVPPDFPGPEWRNQGEQIVEFISSMLTDDAGVPRDGRTEVWAYRGPTGVCMALPRSVGDVYSRGGNVRLLGVICQSETTGRACFWDNIDRATGRTLRGTSVFLDIKALEDGSNLVENCTSCHRGGNVFNVHPRTAVDLTRPSTDPADGRPYDIHPGTTLVPGLTYSSIRYQPVGSNVYGPWINPGPLGLTPSGGCTSCHEIADTARVRYGDGALREGYCSILRMAATTTMPSAASPAGWPSSWGGAFTAHTTALSTRCP